MGSVQVFNAARMQEIEDGTVTTGLVDIHGHLILTKHDGTDVDAGQVKGEKGDTGDKGDDGLSALPLGSVIAWPGAGPTLPNGYLEMNGQAVSAATYSGLAGLFPLWVSGGVLTLPDLRGKAIAGYLSGDDTFGVMNSFVGEKKHLLTANELAMHGHEFGGDDMIGSQGGFTLRTNFAYDATSTASGAGGNYATRGMLPDSNSTQGFITGNQPHNNVQPTYVARWIICAADASGDYSPTVQASLVADVAVIANPAPRFRLGYVGGFTFTANAHLGVSTGVVKDDPTNSFNTTTNVFTVPMSGLYLTTGHFKESTGTVSTCLTMTKNGVEEIRTANNAGNSSAGGFTGEGWSDYVVLNAGDQIYWAFTVGLSTQNDTPSRNTWVSLARIGAA